jgi:hypothetical protein
VYTGKTAHTLQELPVGLGEIRGPRALLAGVFRIAPGWIPEARESPLGSLESSAGDGGRIIFLAGILLEISLESDSGNRKSEGYRQKCEANPHRASRNSIIAFRLL